TEDKTRYGINPFGVSLAVARNLLKADRGTRFIEVDQYGWDHHNGIYEEGRGSYGLFVQATELDLGLSALIDDLAAAPGSVAGKSVLDETIIVVIGEFGRTVGELNRARGRDHYPYAFSGLFLGGGVKGGRVVGATDDKGAGIVDFGWEHKRAIYFTDVVTTIYSAMGIDWTKTVSDTPSGRIFKYTEIDADVDTDSREIAPLF
ncbi:MAG: DUF1501 domain-containing protein, partial [Acidobacteriota bacterium]